MRLTSDPSDASPSSTHTESSPTNSGRAPEVELAEELQALLHRRRQLGAQLRALHLALAGPNAGDPSYEQRLRDGWSDREATDHELGQLMGRWLDRDGQVVLGPDAEVAAELPASPTAVPPLTKPLNQRHAPPPVIPTPEPDAHPVIDTPTQTTRAPTVRTQPMAPPASLDSLRRLKFEGLGSESPQRPALAGLNTQNVHRVSDGLPHPDAEPLHDALVQLKMVIERRDDWLAWPSTLRRAVLLAVITTARALQDRAGHDHDMVALFRKLSAWSAEHRPGSVHGFARVHSPKHGTWAADAIRAQEHLRSLSARPEEQVKLNPERQLRHIEAAVNGPDDQGLRQLLIESLKVLDEADPRLQKLLTGQIRRLIGEPKLKRLRKAVRAQLQQAKQPSPQPDGYPPADWPHFGNTRDKHAVIVGGTSRPRARERIEHAFEFNEVEWLDPSDLRKVESLARRVRNRSVNVVILLRSFCSHSADELLIPALKSSGTPWVSVDQGYGVSQIRRAMERYWEKANGS